MLRTPQKFHYVFNMRELSRVFKGILQIKPKVCKTGTKVKKKKKKKFSTFCTECKTNEETLQKLVIHVNKWHKVSSMKVRLDFLVTF